jgi:hypothetical protein
MFEVLEGRTEVSSPATLKRALEAQATFYKLAQAKRFYKAERTARINQLRLFPHTRRCVALIRILQVALHDERVRVLARGFPERR